MIVVRKFHVKKDERALLFRKGDFVEILGPGEHCPLRPAAPPDRGEVRAGEHPRSSTAWPSSS